MELWLETAAILDERIPKRGLSYCLRIPTNGSPSILTVHHDRHTHEERCTIARHLDIADMIVIADQLCTKWHTKTQQH